MIEEKIYKPNVKISIEDSKVLGFVWESLKCGRSWKEDNIDAYVSKYADLYDKKPYDNEQKGRSTFIDSTVQNYSNSTIVNLLEPLTDTDDVVRMTSNVKDPTVENQADREQNLLNYQFNKKLDKYFLLDESVKLFVKQGILATKLYWDFKSKEIIAESVYQEGEYAEYKDLSVDEFAQVVQLHNEKDEYPLDVVYDEDGTSVNATFVYTDIISENPSFVNVPITNIFWNETAQKISYTKHDFDYVGEVKVMSKSDIIQKLKNDSSYRKLSAEQQDAMFEAKDTSEMSNSFRDNREMVGKFHAQYEDLRKSIPDLSPDKHVVIEMHCYIDVDGDGIDELVHIEVLNDTIIKLQQNNMPDNLIPYNVALFDRTPFTTYGNSIAMFLEDVQYLKTAIMRNMHDTMAYRTFQNYIVEENMFDSVNLKRFINRKPGDVVFAKANLRKGGRLEDKISNIQSESIKRENFEVYSMLDAQAQESSGITSYTQGMDSSSLNQTATGISIVTGMSMKRLLMYARGMIETFFKPTIEGFRVLNKQYLSETTFNKVDGEPMTISKDDIDLDNDIAINVAIKGFDTEKVNQIMQFFNLIGPLSEVKPEAMAEIIPMLIKEVASIWGIAGVSEKLGQTAGEQIPPTDEGGIAKDNPGSYKDNIDNTLNQGSNYTTLNNM